MRTWSAGGLAALVWVAGGSAAWAQDSIHPPIHLLDARGRDVLETGGPVSPMYTCGACHDTNYIHSHSYHACVGLPEQWAPGSRADAREWDLGPGLFGRWSPLTYRRLSPRGESPIDLGTAEWIREIGWRHVGGGPGVRSRSLGRLIEMDVETGGSETHVLDGATGEAKPWDWRSSGVVELDCFICHLARPAIEERERELREGRFAWAATATLSSTQLLERTEDGWSWVEDAFEEDSTTDPAVLELVPPASDHCGACHGIVHSSDEPIRWRPGLHAWSTETTGQIFSSQVISGSAMNILGKSELTRPWDAHAARMLRCSSCHHSLNHPAFRHELDVTRPEHLRFDGRRLPVGEYLRRPSHQLARGESSRGPFAPDLRGTMRRCEDCHDFLAAHRWLPYRERHAEVLLCEACHIPRVHAPARQQTDWTVLTPERTARVEYRGIDGDPASAASLITGFSPALVPRRSERHGTRLAPQNLISSWYWVHGEPPRPVRLHDLERAFFDGPTYHPAIRTALDEDRDGEISRSELRLDTTEKVRAVSARLEAVGAGGASIRGEISPHDIHHGVAEHRWATSECTSCHSASSRVTRPMRLADYVPGDVLPASVGLTTAPLAEAGLRRDGDGLVWSLDPTGSGFFIIGRDRVAWIDGVGGLLVLLTILGALAHGGVRFWSHRRRSAANSR